MLMIIICTTNPVGISANSDTSVIDYNNLTYENALLLLEKNNLDIQLADKKIKIYENKYKDAVSAAKQAENKISYNDYEQLEYRKTERLNSKKVELELAKLRNNRKLLLINLKYQLKSSFINVELLQNDAEVIREELKNLDKKIADVKARIKLGQARDLDYKSLSTQTYTLQNQLNTINKNINSQMIQLKKLLGIEQKKAIKLKSLGNEQAIPDIIQVNDTIISSYLQGDFDLYAINKELELTKLERDLNAIYIHRNNEDIIDEFDIRIVEIETEYAQKKEQLLADLWIEYYNVQSLKEDVTIAELNLELEKLNYDATLAKVSLGIVDVVTESNARIAYNRQKNNLLRTISNCTLAAEQYHTKLGIK